MAGYSPGFVRYELPYHPTRYRGATGFLGAHKGTCASNSLLKLAGCLKYRIWQFSNGY